MSLSEINLQDEIKKGYNNFPKAVVVCFIRHGVHTMYEVKTLVVDTSDYNVRYLGPKRRELAQRLVKKYEDEALMDL